MVDDDKIWLTHYTDRRNIDNIRKTRVLKCARLLVAESSDAHGGEVAAENGRGKTRELLSGVFLRNYWRFLTKDECYRKCLNAHVYFWPDTEDGKQGLVNFQTMPAYRYPRNIGIRFNLSSLKAANSGVEIFASNINTGAQSKKPECCPFKPLGEYKESYDSIVEIVVKGEVVLPDNAEYECGVNDKNESDWQPFFTASKSLPPIPGVELATIDSAVKYRDRDDLLLAVVAEGTAVAGVFTQSSVVGAAVEWCRRQIAQTAPRALIVNAGNANVCTGDIGDQHVAQICQAVAAQIGCRTEQVLAASTGVIGEVLPVEKIIDALPKLSASLDGGQWTRAAEAIRTTDTYPKGATANAKIGDCAVTINGIAKGSGMIEPDMATMLAFIFTDAAIPREVLQAILRDAANKTFNAISVDGDTSTSDTCLAFATAHAANAPPARADDAALTDFIDAFTRVMHDLALQIVRDGEGAKKMIAVKVRGADDDDAAKVIAKSIANSPLVKTAIAGGDANWGRIAMAVGKSGARIAPARLAIFIGGIAVAQNGKRVDDLDEAPIAHHLAGSEIDIEVDVGVGDGCAQVWTCDLTHGYIDINADYRS